MAIRTSYPSYIVEAVAKLKEGLPFNIVLKKISGHYYVYKIGSETDRITGKRISTTDSYIGKITDSGDFVARSVRKGSDIDIAKAVIASHGGKVWLPGEGHAEQLHAQLNLSETDLRILTNLTMNSRMPLSFMAKKLGIKESQLVSRAETLEKRLGIRYFPNVNTHLLGYLTFVAFVRLLLCS